MRGAVLGIKAVITVSLLAYLLSRGDFAGALNQFARGDIFVLAVGLAVLGAQPVLGAVR
jgi:hypothetical protein